MYDVLVAMNSAALKTDIHKLKKGGILIVNLAGFDKKNLKLAHYPEGINPLEDGSTDDFIVYKIDVTRHVKDALATSGLGNKEMERSKTCLSLDFCFGCSISQWIILLVLYLINLRKSLM